MRVCVFYIFIPLIFSSNLLGQQATDESQELQLNLEQFPDEQFSTKELELNLEQFDQTDPIAEIRNYNLISSSSTTQIKTAKAEIWS